MKKNYSVQKESAVPKYIGFIVLMAFVFMLGWNAGVNHTGVKQGVTPQTTVTSPNGQAEKVSMEVFWDAWNLLSANYVDPHALVTEEMVFGAIKGMVKSVNDPYTTFMTPKENKEFRESLGGHLEGIGAELTLRNGVLTVISPLKGSPAQAAGLQPEDIIYKVNDEFTEDMSLEQAVMKIRGPGGTHVTLTVIRKNRNEPIEIKIIRAMINVNSIDWEMKGEIAILEINQFGDSTNQEFNKAVSDILVKRPAGIILDLRYNGGGIFGRCHRYNFRILRKRKSRHHQKTKSRRG